MSRAIKGAISNVFKACWIVAKWLWFSWLVGWKCSTEAVCILIYCGQKGTSRGTQEVLRALLILYHGVVKLPTLYTPIHRRIADNSKYGPYLRNYVGALNGTHILLFLSKNEVAPFIDRNHHITHKALVACTFDFQFRYVFAVWEGSAIDQRVLQDVIDNGGFGLLLSCELWVY